MPFKFTKNPERVATYFDQRCHFRKTAHLHVSPQHHHLFCTRRRAPWSFIRRRFSGTVPRRPACTGCRSLVSPKGVVYFSWPHLSDDACISRDFAGPRWRSVDLARWKWRDVDVLPSPSTRLAVRRSTASSSLADG